VQYRSYDINECVYFRRTKEAFGGLSNMAPGFPLEINGVRIRTSEALYQACKFPHLPKVQEQIISEKSPMAAKMITQEGELRTQWRADWFRANVSIMRWCLRVKLAQNWKSFGDLLLSTGDKPIVEYSTKDTFWGAKMVNDTLVGSNVLGRLLMELREGFKMEIRSPGCVLSMELPNVSDFLLYGSPIREVRK
jgi:type I restriction enzyme S subunit